jgi:hypothetical protein
VRNIPDDVHAFKATWETGGMSIILTGGESVGGSVEEIPIKEGVLEPETESDFEYFAGGIPVSFFHFRGWRILLYRPGYEVIELPGRCWAFGLLQPQVDHLNWKRSQDFDAKLRAIETICSRRSFGRPNEQTLRFAAQEYERLANEHDCPSADQRTTLLDKAKQLRADSH